MIVRDQYLLYRFFDYAEPDDGTAAYLDDLRKAAIQNAEIS